MKRVGIYAKKHHPNAVSFGRDVMEWLAARGVEVLLEEDLARSLEVARDYVDNDIPERAELVIVLGGDGTLISVARHVGERMKPILGVNLGSLGFLTEITRDETFATLERVMAGNYELSSRMMLDAVVQREGREIARYSVLGDAVIRIEVTFQDQHVVLTADGQSGMPLRGGDVVELRQSHIRTLLIKSPSKDYFEVLRTKLRWGER